MKSLVLALGLIITAASNAQDCKNFYYLNSKEVQMTTYDKKGEESGKLTYQITDVSKSGAATTAKFTSEMVNEKGKQISKGGGSIKCSGSTFYVDARAALPNDQTGAYKDMEVKADEVFIEYPASMKEGESLKDVNFKMEVYNKGTLHSTVVFDETNRKVGATETITTPAGSWACNKVTYTGKIKATIAPLNIGIPVNFEVTEWFAPGFGIVKTESRNKNGKLMGSTLITSVKK